MTGYYLTMVALSQSPSFMKVSYTRLLLICEFKIEREMETHCLTPDGMWAVLAKILSISMALRAKHPACGAQAGNYVKSCTTEWQRWGTQSGWKTANSLFVSSDPRPNGSRDKE